MYDESTYNTVRDPSKLGQKQLPSLLIILIPKGTSWWVEWGIIDTLFKTINKMI